MKLPRNFGKHKTRVWALILGFAHIYACMCLRIFAKVEFELITKAMELGGGLVTLGSV